MHAKHRAFVILFFKTVKQSKRVTQRYCLQDVLKIKKARATEIWLMSFLSVRILLCNHNTSLPMQLRDNKDQSLQLIIFLIGCHEEMGPDYPSKRLMFYVAFAALSVLIVLCYYFTNSVFKKVNVDYNCCID